MDLRAVAFRNHPHVTFISVSTVLSFFALRPTPSPVPIILTLTGLLLYARILIPGPHALRYATLLWIAIALGGSLSRIAPSLDALSTPGLSVLVLFILSALTSLLSLGAIYVDTKFCTRFVSPCAQITLFPALWASLWFGVSYLSPIGRLSAWSPTDGIGSYDWITPLLGPPGIDWVVAAWAVVCSQAIGAWFIGPQVKDHEEPLITHDAPILQQPSPLSYTASVSLLAAFLVTLTIPSLFLNNFPLATSSPHSTPLIVGCILPHKNHALTLDDYIKETLNFNSAQVLLWPEGAVTFNSEAERDEGFFRVQNATTSPDSYIGISFEEAFSNSDSDSWRSDFRRTGLAIISRSSKKPHLVYYKRHLVPVAESFSLTHSTLPPEIFTFQLPPKGMKKPDWAPGPNFTRPIPLTTSICLDFAHPLPFAELDSRPALILAPARTWDTSVGYTMWRQAKQRAEEIGAIALWCDGGNGGVSGVAGQGFSDFTQLGSGSWTRKIGIQYPFNEHRTPYAYFGNLTILLFWALVFGSSGKISFMFGSLQIDLLKKGLGRLRNMYTGQRNNTRRIEEANLLD